VGFLVDKVALGQVFSVYFGFPCQFSFHRLLHTHHHLPSGAGTIGQTVTAVPSGLRLTPPPETSEKLYVPLTSTLQKKEEEVAPSGVVPDLHPGGADFKPQPAHRLSILLLLMVLLSPSDQMVGQHLKSSPLNFLQKSFPIHCSRNHTLS
jgi:hypothetical protein